MPTNDASERPVRIFISVAEDSADLHAARLITVAREQHPHWQFYGLAGPRMRAAGAAALADLTPHAAMLSGVLGALKRGRAALRQVEAAWRAERPDLVIVMDSSALHLPMARRAKRRGLPVLYYIAPQTWASRPWRNRDIRRSVARVACILPFEEAYFRARGVHAEYVGHPLMETLATEQPLAETVELLKRRAAGRPIVAVLPGSRVHVIDTLLPLQLDVIRKLRAAGEPVYAAVSCVSESRREQIRRHLAGSGVASTATLADVVEAAGPAAGGAASDAGADVVVADNASLLAAADLVLVASGTATLEVAFRRKPMIVMYDAGRALYWPWRIAGGLAVRLRHLSLVNILAQARVVPEFMPFVPDTGPIAAVARQLLNDAAWRSQMVAQMDAVVRPPEASQASQRVCGLIAELLGVEARASRSPAGRAAP
jgi:lipid-A-disaccharide synthase